MLALPCPVQPSPAKVCSKQRSRRRVICSTSTRLRTMGRITANSSPPSRARMSPGAVYPSCAALLPAGSDPGLVAELIVDLFEIVEVDIGQSKYTGRLPCSLNRGLVLLFEREPVGMSVSRVELQAMYKIGVEPRGFMASLASPAACARDSPSMAPGLERGLEQNYIAVDGIRSV